MPRALCVALALLAACNASTNEETEVTCEANGVIYAVGEGYQEDDCNRCGCQSDGMFACTDLSCEPFDSGQDTDTDR